MYWVHSNHDVSINHRVQVSKKSTFEFIRIFGNKGNNNGQFVYPIGIAVDGEYLYVTSDHCVQIFDKTGVYIHKFGQKGKGDGEFDGPQGVSVKSARVYVCDYNNHRVQVFE